MSFAILSSVESLIINNSCHFTVESFTSGGYSLLLPSSSTAPIQKKMLPFVPENFHRATTTTARPTPLGAYKRFDFCHAVTKNLYAQEALNQVAKLTATTRLSTTASTAPTKNWNFTNQFSALYSLIKLF